jgi:hypothetical protein
MCKRLSERKIPHEIIVRELGMTEDQRKLAEVSLVLSDNPTIDVHLDSSGRPYNRQSYSFDGNGSRRI